MHNDTFESATIKSPFSVQQWTKEEFALSLLEACKRLYGANTSIEKLQQILTEKGSEKVFDRMAVIDLAAALKPEKE
jgi:hypothetical protein